MEKRNLYDELRSLANNNATITFKPALSGVDLSDKAIEEGATPYEGVSPFARFVLSIIDNNTKEVATANISCREDISSLYYGMKDALTCVNLYKWGFFNMMSPQKAETKTEEKAAENPDDLSIAYTTRFEFGTYGESKKSLKGLSPAELLLENTNNKKVLDYQKKALEKAVKEGKYVEENTALIKAIDEALELSEAGALSKEDAEKARPLSPAYTVRFKFGTYGKDKKSLVGMSPAELLLEDVGNASVLNEQYKILKANIADETKAKYKKANEELFAAICDASKLVKKDESGNKICLVDKEKVAEAAEKKGTAPKSKTTGEFPVFESGIRIPSVNESGDSREYEIGVYCNPCMKYPIRVNIVERMCPVIKNPDGTRQADTKNASSCTEKEIRLSANSFMDRVDKMYSIYKNMETMEFPKDYKRVNDIRKERIEEAKKNPQRQSA